MYNIFLPIATSIGRPPRDSISVKGTANGRRTLFAPHLTPWEFYELSTKHMDRYVQGLIRISKRRDRIEAYVAVETLPDDDVLISGHRDRNRAIEGDVVGVELFNLEDPDEIDGSDGDESKPSYCGRVVSILERLPRMYSGTLSKDRPGSSTKKTERKKQGHDQRGQPKVVWFKPVSP